MKWHLLFTSLLILGADLCAQNAFFDAKALYQLDELEMDSLDKYRFLLVRKEDQDDWRNLKEFARHPFEYIVDNKPAFNTQVIPRLREYWQQYDALRLANGTWRYQKKSIYNLSLPDAPEPQSPLGTVSGLADLLSGGNLGAAFNAQLIDATATLLLDRSKQELMLGYLVRLREEFGKRPFLLYRETPLGIEADTLYLRQLFPSTYHLLSDEDQTFSFNIGKSLQNALEEDLHDFLANANRYLIPDYLKSDLPYHYFAALHLAFAELSRGVHPALILSTLAGEYGIQGIPRPVTDLDRFRFSLQLLDRISQSLYDLRRERVWVSLDDLTSLNLREKEYYVCLLYLSDPGLFEGVGLEARRLAVYAGKNQEFKQLQGLVFGMLQLFEHLENKIAGMRLVQGPQTDRTGANSVRPAVEPLLGFEDQDQLRGFYEYAFMFRDLVEFSRKYVCEWTPQTSFCDLRFQEIFLPLTGEALQISLSVESKEYAAAFLKTLKLVEAFNIDNPYFEWPAGLVKYLTLAADVVSADSAEEIRTIMEAVILPVRSYRIKRNTATSIFLSAYVGGNAGAEWLDNDQLVNPWAPQLSPFTPIGIDLNWGAPNGSSNSLFISVLDLGAIVSYRFQDTGRDSIVSSRLPQIRWEQLLSPGIFYVHGLRNAPLSWGLGAHLTPKLRAVENEKNIRVDDVNALRFSAFLAVDLPLLSVSVKNEARAVPPAFPLPADRPRVILRQEIENLSRTLLRTTQRSQRKELEQQIKRLEKQLEKR